MKLKIVCLAEWSARWRYKPYFANCRGSNLTSVIKYFYFFHIWYFCSFYSGYIDIFTPGFLLAPPVKPCHVAPEVPLGRWAIYCSSL